MKRLAVFLGFWLALALSGEAFATAKPMPAPIFQAIGASGPLAGGKVYAYEAGTTTAKDTYTDSTGATPNAWPVILDSAGRGNVWLVGRYKIKVYDSADSLVYEVDQIEGDTSSISTTDIQELSSSFCTDSQASDSYICLMSPTVTTYTDGMLIRFKANTANTGAATLQLDALAAKTIKKSFNVDLVTGDILAGQIISVVYDATQGVWQLVGSGSSTSDADTLDAQHGTYYLDASNLTGTVANARLPNRIAAYHYVGTDGSCTSYNALAGSSCAKTGTGVYTLTITADADAYCVGSTAYTLSTPTQFTVYKASNTLISARTFLNTVATDMDFNLICFTNP